MRHWRAPERQAQADAGRSRTQEWPSRRGGAPDRCGAVARSDDHAEPASGRPRAARAGGARCPRRARATGCRFGGERPGAGAGPGRGFAGLVRHRGIAEWQVADSGAGPRAQHLALPRRCAAIAGAVDLRARCAAPQWRPAHRADPRLHRAHAASAVGSGERPPTGAGAGGHAERLRHRHPAAGRERPGQLPQ